MGFLAALSKNDAGTFRGSRSSRPEGGRPRSGRLARCRACAAVDPRAEARDESPAGSPGVLRRRGGGPCPQCRAAVGQRAPGRDCRWCRCRQCRPGADCVGARRVRGEQTGAADRHRASGSPALAPGHRAARTRRRQHCRRGRGAGHGGRPSPGHGTAGAGHAAHSHCLRLLHLWRSGGRGRGRGHRRRGGRGRHRRRTGGPLRHPVDPLGALGGPVGGAQRTVVGGVHRGVGP